MYHERHPQGEITNFNLCTSVKCHRHLFCELYELYIFTFFFTHAQNCSFFHLNCYLSNTLEINPSLGWSDDALKSMMKTNSEINGFLYLATRQQDGWWISLHWRKMWWYMEETIDRGLFRFMHNEIPAVLVETLGNCQSELFSASWGATVTGRRKAVLWHCFTLQHTNNTSGILFQTERSNHMDWIHNQRNKKHSIKLD